MLEQNKALKAKLKQYKLASESGLDEGQISDNSMLDQDIAIEDFGGISNKQLDEIDNQINAGGQFVEGVEKSIEVPHRSQL